MRPTLDEYFMQFARDASARATCDRAFVGAVLVKDKHIVTTAYNGAPSGLPDCNEIGHWMVDNHCVRAVHAEMNAIIQCAIHGVSSVGTTLYCTHSPCVRCAQALINAGIKRAVYEIEYRPDPLVMELYSLAGIEVVHYGK